MPPASDLERLLAALADNQVPVTPSEVRDLMKLAQIPTDLVGFTQAANGILAALAAANTLSPTATRRWPIRAWQLFLEFIAARGDSLGLSICLGENPVRGRTADFPVYAALYPRMAAEWRESAELLAGVLLLLAEEPVSKGGEVLPPTVIPNLSQVIRRMAKQDRRRAPFFKELPATARNLGDLLDKIVSIETSPEAADDKRMVVRALKALLGRVPTSPAILQKPQPEAKSSGLRPEPFELGGLVVDPGEYEDQGDSPIPSAGTEQADSHRPSQPRPQVALAEGGGQESATAQRPFRDDIQIAKARLRAQHRTNQHFFSAWMYPSKYDLSQLFEALEPGSPERPYLGDADCRELLTRLLTGRAGSMMFGATRENADGIAIDLETSQWVAVVPRPEQMASPHASVADLFEPVLEHLRFPVPEQAKRLLQALRPKRNQVDSDRTTRVDDNLQNWLRRVNRCRGTRLSEARLQRALAAWLLRETDDLVEVGLICGDLAQYQHSGQYYYTPTVGRLRDVYRSAWNRMCIDGGRPDWRLPTTEGRTKNSYCSEYVGCRLRLRDGARKTMAAQLLSKAKAYSAPRRNPRAQRDFHNAYTLYTALQMSFAMGLRGVRSPIDNWGRVDLERGLCVLDEKDIRGRRVPRLMPLPPLVRRQLQYYRDHVRAIVKRLRLAIPDGTPPLFFLAATGGVEEVSPTTLQQQLGMAIPGNIGRPWLRTALREAGVNAEVVDALMGHARAMQGAFDGFSSLSPGEVGATVAPILDRLLRDDGWTSTRGLRA